MNLFRFPYVVHREFFKEFNVGEVFGIYFLSERSKQLVRSFHWQNMETVVDCANFKAVARIRFGQTLEKVAYFSLTTTEGEDGVKTSYFQINDLRLDISSHYNPMLEKPKEESFALCQSYFGRLCIYMLMEVFGSIGHLTVSYGIKRSFGITGDHIITFSLTHHNIIADIEQLTDYFAFKYKYLASLFPLAEGGLYPETMVMNGSRIIIKNAQWLTEATLLQFKGSEAMFLNTMVNEQAIIALINKWLHEDNNTLNSVILCQDLIHSIDQNIILDNFDFKQWNPEDRARHYFGNTQLMSYFPTGTHLLDCHDGFDLVRESDGLLCTVKFWAGSAVCFYVWHQRFPT